MHTLYHLTIFIWIEMKFQNFRMVNLILKRSISRLPLLSKISINIKKESELPVFDFHNGCRSKETNIIRLEKDDIVIVEGLHALNPVITDCLPHENLLRFI